MLADPASLSQAFEAQLNQRNVPEQQRSHPETANNRQPHTPNCQLTLYYRTMIDDRLV